MTFWRWKAPAYSLLRRLPPSRQIFAAEQKNVSLLLEQFPPSPGRHLDLGSGTGDSLHTLPPESKRVVSDAEIAMLRRNPAAWRVAAAAEVLPFPDESFIFVSAVGLLEYINQIEKVFREVRRVLLPAGHFLFTTSPLNWANRLRGLGGEKLHFYAEKNISAHVQALGWRILGHHRSLLQEQWLVACPGERPRPGLGC